MHATSEVPVKMLTQDELVRLTPPERLALISRLWDSMEDNQLPLTAAQRAYLANLAAFAEQQSPVGGEAWQALIFDTARAMELKPGDAFGAIYRAFLGRPNGPRAGWLLASLNGAFVVARLRQAAAGGGQQ